MKIFANIMKVVAALAAVAGVVYIVATYGDKIVAWAKGLLCKLRCCDDECCECECNDNGECLCDCDCSDCDCNDCACDEDESCEEVTEAETVEAAEDDFEA